jgi:hypothetical protein
MKVVFGLASKCLYTTVAVDVEVRFPAHHGDLLEVVVGLELGCTNLVGAASPRPQ